MRKAIEIVEKELETARKSKDHFYKLSNIGRPFFSKRFFRLYELDTAIVRSLEKTLEILKAAENE